VAEWIVEGREGSHWGRRWWGVVAVCLFEMGLLLVSMSTAIEWHSMAGGLDGLI
jgi:hypothetical protein